MTAALELAGVAKTFTMHLQGGVRLPVVSGVAFAVRPGECTVLAGPSGAGKSSILKMIFGSYRCDRGQILVRHGDAATDVASAAPRQILALRRSTVGYVSQFLRAVPRVAALDVVAEPLVAAGTDREAARKKAAELLRRLNIARGFLPDLPLLLLDEPTASLDAENSAVVIDLIAERKRRGTAIVAIVHDVAMRERIADTVIDITRFGAAA